MADDTTAVEDEPEASPQAPADATGVDIDWEALAVAVENQLPTSHSFLERDCGEVVTLQATGPVPPEAPAGPGNWIAVPPRPSREGYRTMQRFVDQLDEPELKEKLAATLVGRGAFRRFKDQLLESPEERQQWFAFKDAEVYAYISRWLEREGIEARNPPPSSSSRSRFSAAVRRSSARDPVGEPLSGDPADEDGVLDWHSAIAPFDRPERVFRPARAALLVIDMQRVFVDPSGSSYRRPRRPLPGWPRWCPTGAHAAGRCC